MIFEDLSIYGFKNVPISKAFDYDHMKQTMNKLAMWHAVTATIIDKVILNNGYLLGFRACSILVNIAIIPIIIIIDIFI